MRKWGSLRRDESPGSRQFLTVRWSIPLDGGENADEVGFSTYVYGEGKDERLVKSGGLPMKAPFFFLGGRVVAISGAGESPRERLSVGTDHPDSDEHNTRGVG